MSRKILSLIIAFTFLTQSILPVGYAQELGARLPEAFRSLALNPVLLRYLSINSANPDNYFNFLLDTGTNLRGLKSFPTSEVRLTAESRKLINYFFLGLTIPEDAFWVNLQPNQENKITSLELAKTDLGKVLLEQDLKLKKDMANYLSPQNPIGKEFWTALYQKTNSEGQNMNITTNNRVWIVPEKAVVVETEDGALIAEAKLKVMLESEYFEHLRGGGDSSEVDKVKDDQIHQISEQLMKEIVIPAITKDVNDSPGYAPLRQIYHSLILAQYFKKYNNATTQQHNNPYTSYLNSGKTAGLESQAPWSKDAIYQDYLKSYTQGEYKFIDKTIFNLKRMYFSGGISFFSSSPISSPITGEGVEGEATQSSPIITFIPQEELKFTENRQVSEETNKLIKNQNIPVTLSTKNPNNININIANDLKVIKPSNLKEKETLPPQSSPLKNEITHRTEQSFFTGIKKTLLSLSLAGALLFNPLAKPPEAGIIIKHSAENTLEFKINKALEAGTGAALIKLAQDKGIENILPIIVSHNRGIIDWRLQSGELDLTRGIIEALTVEKVIADLLKIEKNNPLSDLTYIFYNNVDGLKKILFCENKKSESSRYEAFNRIIVLEEKGFSEAKLIETNRSELISFLEEETGDINFKKSISRYFLENNNDKLLSSLKSPVARGIIFGEKILQQLSQENDLDDALNRIKETITDKAKSIIERETIISIIPQVFEKTFEQQRNVLDESTGEFNKKTNAMRNFLKEAFLSRELEENLQEKFLDILSIYSDPYDLGIEALNTLNKDFVKLILNDKVGPTIKEKAIKALMQIGAMDNLKNIKPALEKLSGKSELAKSLYELLNTNIPISVEIPENNDTLRIRTAQILLNLKGALSLSEEISNKILKKSLNKAEFSDAYFSVENANSNFEVTYRFLNRIKYEIGEKDAGIALNAILAHEIGHNILTEMGLKYNSLAAKSLHEFISDLVMDLYFQKINRPDIQDKVHAFLEYNKYAQEAEQEKHNSSKEHKAARAQKKWLVDELIKNKIPYDAEKLLKTALNIIDKKLNNKVDFFDRNIFKDFIKELSRKYANPKAESSSFLPNDTDYKPSQNTNIPLLTPEKLNDALRGLISHLLVPFKPSEKIHTASMEKNSSASSSIENSKTPQSFFKELQKTFTAFILASSLLFNFNPLAAKENHPQDLKNTPIIEQKGQIRIQENINEKNSPEIRETLNFLKDKFSIDASNSEHSMKLAREISQNLQRLKIFIEYLKTQKEIALESDLTANNLIFLNDLQESPEILKRLTDRDGIIKNLQEKIYSKETFYYQNEMLGKLKDMLNYFREEKKKNPDRNYDENINIFEERIKNATQRPELSTLSNIMLLKLDLLQKSLEDPAILSALGDIISRSINNQSEYGGSFKLSSQGWRPEEIKNARGGTNYNPGYDVNKRLDGSSGAGFHTHTIYIDNSKIGYQNAGPSTPDVEVMDENDAPDIIFTSMGHPKNSAGEDIKNKVVVNVKFYWSDKHENVKDKESMFRKGPADRLRIVDFGNYILHYDNKAIPPSSSPIKENPSASSPMEEEKNSTPSEIKITHTENNENIINILMSWNKYNNTHFTFKNEEYIRKNLLSQKPALYYIGSPEAPEAILVAIRPSTYKGTENFYMIDTVETQTKGKGYGQKLVEKFVQDKAKDNYLEVIVNYKGDKPGAQSAWIDFFKKLEFISVNNLTNHFIREPKTKGTGGIDLSNIELTLKDEKFVSSLNPADYKILLAAKALKDGWEGLGLLRLYEAMGFLKEKVVPDIQNHELLLQLLTRLKSQNALAPQGLQFLYVMQKQRPN